MLIKFHFKNQNFDKFWPNFTLKNKILTKFHFKNQILTKFWPKKSKCWQISTSNQQITNSYVRFSRKVFPISHWPTVPLTEKPSTAVPMIRYSQPSARSLFPENVHVTPESSTWCVQYKKKKNCCVDCGLDGGSWRYWSVTVTCIEALRTL